MQAAEPITLWEHQKEGIARALQGNEFGFLWEPGCGKSAAVVNVIRELFTRNRRVMSTLVLAPPIMIETWRREFLKFSKIDSKYLVPLVGTGKQRLATAQRSMRNGRTLEPRIWITNYESLLNEELYAFFQQFAPKILVVDEVHRCKNMSAKRTKAAIKLADTADYRYILTGTPVLNTPLDLFAQFRILDRGATFGVNFFLFRSAYFIDKNCFMSKQKYFPNWQIKPGAIEEMNRLMAKKSMFVKKSECLDLPPFVKKCIYVELSSEQRKHYDSLKKDFITFVEDRTCSTPLAITKALRMQQIVSGFLPLQGEVGIESTHRFENNPRKEALRELLKDLGEENKIIVWACFKANYADVREICGELGLRFVEIHGEVSAKAKDEAVHDFNNLPDVKVLIGHAKAGGIGISLCAAQYSIFYSRNFSLEDDVQAEARNYRGGSEIHDHVTRIDIIATDTIDELVVKALETKTQLGVELLRREIA